MLAKTDTYAIFSVPKLITPTTQDSLKLTRNSTIDLENKVKWGDATGW